MFLAIKLNNKIKIPEKLKLTIIKAVKLALYEVNQLESNKNLFTTTKKNYNLKNEIAQITWHYNLFIREINESSYCSGISASKNYTGFIIDDFTYQSSFKQMVNLFQYVYIADSFIDEKIKDADIIISLTDFMVIRKDL